MKVRMLTLCAGLASVAAVMAVVVSGCCTPGNQAPIATDQNVSMTSGTTATVTVTVVDPDNAPGPLTYTLLTTPNPATEGTLHAPGNPAAAPILPTVAFTPIAGFTGCAQFTYTANDGEANSNVGTVTFAVDNQAPTATDVAADVGANQTTTVTLQGTDPDNCPPNGLRAVNVTNPSNGVINSISGMTVQYTPNGNFVGQDTFTYQVSDGLATSSNTATATLTVAITCPTNRNIRMTLQNETDRYIHYHMHLIAFREDVAACDDSRYESAGYVHYPTGVSFGCYSFTQDLFYYYHQNGRFRTNISDSSTGLLSGIAPGSSSSPTLDPTFRNTNVPAPSLILFHDPQSNVPFPFNQDRSAITINPTLDDVTGCLACGRCSQASWYYVNENDAPIGFALSCSPGRAATDLSRLGRYYRVPAETQDTVCWDCVADLGTLPIVSPDTSAAHWLHNTAVGSAVGPNPAGDTNLRCYEYYLGGVITYIFTTAGDQASAGTAAPPSLKWEVKTISGQVLRPRNG